MRQEYILWINVKIQTWKYIFFFYCTCRTVHRACVHTTRGALTQVNYICPLLPDELD